ncbi:hypothetical protein MAJHIDBO_01325 [Propionibacterium freudenreichii subsp. shermanii]|nr:hypothetical protein MAJHIDBO_01325 [Propionibacterium freudenreichii subsp. shermanii]SPS09120.1 hypothetical protein MAJHIDBO_01325 [Propionibacterium freudenreichii subsp. shermanii]
MVPIVSDSRRKLIRPRSGFGPVASQPIMAGISWRRISTARLEPVVSASMWRKAEPGSEKPSALRRSFAASGDSRIWSSDSLLTVSSRGE